MATRGDNAFQGDKPAEAFKEIEDIKNRAAALNAPATSYDHQAVASDLIRATRGVEPESPELSAKLLNMQRNCLPELTEADIILRMRDIA